MNLSPRLKKIISLLDLPIRVADIGTDHAYIPIYLAKKSDCSKIIASDYNQDPYLAAQKHIKNNGVSDLVELRLGSGLSVLDKSEVDSVIIAGMGGQTIRNIIANEYKLAQRLEQMILQPMAGAGSLRVWLAKNQFKITKEVLVKEKERLYQLIAIEPGPMEIKDQFLLELGPKLIEDKPDLLTEYFKRLKKEWLKIINEISINAPHHPKVQKLENKLARLREVKECL